MERNEANRIDVDTGQQASRRDRPEFLIVGDVSIYPQTRGYVRVSPPAADLTLKGDLFLAGSSRLGKTPDGAYWITDAGVVTPRQPEGGPWAYVAHEDPRLGLTVYLEGKWGDHVELLGPKVAAHWLPVIPGERPGKPEAAGIGVSGGAARLTSLLAAMMDIGGEWTPAGVIELYESINLKCSDEDARADLATLARDHPEVLERSSNRCGAIWKVHPRADRDGADKGKRR